MEYFNIYPFTQEREDARVAMLCQTIVASMTGKVPDISMFLPKFDTVSTPVKTEEEKLADERAYVQMLVSTGFAVMENKQ
jgi:hypothetical protein